MPAVKRLDKSLSSLIKDADAVFSKYIRTKYSIGGGCQCFICGVWMPISRAQNGHYMNRDQMPTRYDEMNCRPVFPDCNCYDMAHIQRFRLKLIETIGADKVRHLHEKSHSLQKFMRHELVEIIETYTVKLKELGKI